MTTEQIKMLPTRDLLAIVRTTNPAGRLWLEYMTARDELARRGQQAAMCSGRGA